MSETTALPPMPDVDGFRDDATGSVNLTAYNTAIAAWKAVCQQVVASNERVASSKAFWRSW